MSIYPSLEDMKVDELNRAQIKVGILNLDNNVDLNHYWQVACSDNNESQLESSSSQPFIRKLYS